MSRALTIPIALAAVLAAGCAGDASTVPAVVDPADRVAIAFSYSSGDYTNSTDIWVMAQDKSGLRRIVTGDSSANDLPDWSPDGRTLVFSRHSFRTRQAGLWLVQADGSGLRELQTGVSSPFGGRWSPDGLSIVFIAFSSSGNDIDVIRADGTGLRTIASFPGSDAGGPPSWSRGGRIAFTRSAPGVQGIWTVKPDGSDLTQITTFTGDYEPRWSPDGKSLVFTSYLTYSIMMVDADGSKRRGLTSGAFDQFPAWSPDGKWILFDRRVPYGYVQSCPLYRILAAGGDPVAFVAERTRSLCAGSAWRAAPVASN